VTDDTLSEVKSYADEHDLTQAEAMRQLLDAGLDVKNGRATMPADEIRRDLRELQERLDDQDDDADLDETDQPETRVIQSGQIVQSPLRLIQVAMTLAILALVTGGML
jgi:hypothetical protein